MAALFTLKHKCQPFVLWLCFLEWVCVCECVCVWLDNHSDDRQYPGCVLPIAKKGKKSSADHHCDYPGAHTYTHTRTLAQDIHTIAHTLNQSAMQRLQGHLSTFPTLIFPKCLKAFFSGPHIKTEQSYGYFGSTSGWYISTYRKTSISQFRFF